MPAPQIVLVALVALGLVAGVQKTAHGIKKAGAAVGHTVKHGLIHKHAKK